MSKKSLLVTIFSILLPAISFAGNFNGWIYQNPYPTSNTLLAVKFITPEKGWIAGEKGTILYTEDSGETWEAQESGTGQDLKSIAFVNEKQGWAVGNGGTIIHTDDGGKVWKPQGDGDNNASLNKVFFLNEKEGWIIGATPMGVVLHTTDSGKKWEKQETGIYRAIASIYFLNPQTGWILAGDEIYSTKDGGKNWEKTNLDIKITRPKTDTGGRPVIQLGGETIEPDWWQGDIYFTDERNGWAVFGLWYMSHSEDGGKTWQTKDIGHSQGHIIFTDERNGCTAGTSILCTEDGGKTWEEKLGYKSSDSSTISLWGISFADKKVGWAVGKGVGGKIYKTEDGGKSWTVKSRPFSSSYFIDSKTGWDTPYDEKGKKDSIVKTEDGGSSWTVQKKFDTNIDINRFFFIDSATGWAVGRQRIYGRSGTEYLNYFILHTTDSGKRWTTQFDERAGKEQTLSDGLSDVFFINRDIGWVVGSKGLILHTNDGGKNWERQKSETKLILHDVVFSDAKKGVAIGDRRSALGEDSETDKKAKGIILYTEDGGQHWRVVWEKRQILIMSIFFVDKDTGWATVETRDGVLLLNSRDGGKTWSEGRINAIGQMFFLDKNRGVILTFGNYDFFTRDGGKTWERQLHPIRNYPWHISEMFEKKDK